MVDRPVGVVDAVNTATPALWFVHVDHLNRPVRMTNTAKAVVWDAVFLPWGGVHAITGSATLDARFPGQWFQLESGLHYNWHRQYDPTIGRYIQADPLGFVDGPSVYAYANSSPIRLVDSDGRQVSVPAPGVCLSNPYALTACAAVTVIIYVCMARGGKKNIENEYSREARLQPDPCAWLKAQYDNASGAERLKIKAAQKSLGCRPTGGDY